MRFSRFGRLLLLLGASLLIGGPAARAAQAPSLAELAKKEEERRKAQKEPAKVITTKDLPASAQRPAGPAPAPAAGAAGQQKPAGSKPGDPADPKAGSAADAKAAEAQAEERGETWWRGRMADLRESLRQSEMFAEALQSRINALRGEFTSRDNPVQRARIAEDREKALAELNRVKGEVEKTKQAIADLEEEARKAGVPPGWLR